MQAQQAILNAKAYVAEFFGTEDAINIGLEELEFDEMNDAWNVTIGFSRPWNAIGSVLSQALAAARLADRTYKVVQVSNKDGSLIAIRNRDVLLAA